jgi:hypothetical protein
MTTEHEVGAVRLSVSFKDVNPSLYWCQLYLLKSTEFSAGFTPPCTGVMVFDPAIN